MKILVLAMIVSLLMVVGCSSKEKKEAEQNAQDAVEQVENDTQDAIDEAEEKSEEIAEEVEEKAEEMTSNSDVASSFNCSLGSDQRSVEIVNGDNPKCEVFYTKNGERLSIAKANWDGSYCDKVANQVKGNLENAGFSCN